MKHALAFWWVLCWPLYGLQAQKHPVKLLGINEGLSNNSVMTIYEDYRGIMWFGTYDGLNSYDGYTCKIFRNTIGDSASLINNTIYALEGGPLHQLWIGTPKGACLYNPVTASFSPVQYQPLQGQKPQPLQDLIHTIKNIGNNQMLMGSQQNGLLKFDGPNTPGNTLPLHTAAGNLYQYDAVAIEPATNNEYWVFVQNVGLCKYNRLRQDVQLINNQITNAFCIKTDGAAGLWVGTQEGLFKYNQLQNGYGETVIDRKVKVMNLSADKAGNLWIASDGNGLLVLPKNAAKAQAGNADSSQPDIKSNTVWSIYHQADGRRWVGTLRGGVSIIEPSSQYFQHVLYKAPDAPNVADNFILSFFEDSLKGIWIGTDGAGLRCWNRQTNQSTVYRHKDGDSRTISSNFVTGITTGPAGNIWLSTWYGGINRIAPNGTITQFPLYNPLTKTEEPNAWLVFMDAQKQLWASTSNSGTLYHFNPALQKFELFDADIKDLQCMYETNKGQLWAGNYSSLISIDRKKLAHRFYNLGYTVRSVIEDKNHQFWVGTQDGGLLLFNRQTGKYRQFTTTDGLPGNTILRMEEDKNGFLWLSTYNGLCRFDPRQHTVRSFTVADGLQSNQFSYNAAAILSTGELAFGGINGFNLFKPETINSRQRQLPILLTGLAINNVPIEKDNSAVQSRLLDQLQSLRLPFNTNSLSIDFTSLDYSNADKLQYAYLLQGWDKDWNHTGANRKASYARLYEGDYEFLVKVMDGNGNWSKPVSLLQLTVLPPWYRSWWARMLYLLAAIALVYLYARYTRRQAKLKYDIRLAQLEKEKEKELAERKLSIFTHISHELRTPLSLIIDPLQKAISDANDKQYGQLGQDLATTQRNARRMLSLVDQLLLFRKADSGGDVLHVSPIDLRQICTDTYQCFVGQATSKNIRYELQLPEYNPSFFGDYEKLEIMLFNLLSNAFKFTASQQGQVTLAVVEEAEAVTITVKDNGAGIKEADLERIFDKFSQGSGHQTGFGIGLYLVKHYAHLHKGEVTCATSADAGTSFSIRLLKGKAHFGDTVITEAPAAGQFSLLKELNNQEPTPVPAATSLAGLAAEEVLSSKKAILIVDDDTETRQYLQRIFTESYLVYTATNGLEGWEQANRHTPDLIISDVSMEGMDGIAFCGKIRQSATLGHIPVILLSAVTNVDVQLKGISDGATDYITKPFKSDLLLAKVESILKSNQQLKQHYLSDITLQPNHQKLPVEYQQFIQNCIQLIEDNIGAEDFSIQTIARGLNMSHSTLYNKIKQVSGMSVNAFIRSVRLRRAAVLLVTEDISVSQAAFQVGLEDVRYFREQFTKMFDVTPSEYVKKHRHLFNEELNKNKTGSSN